MFNFVCRRVCKHKNLGQIHSLLIQLLFPHFLIWLSALWNGSTHLPSYINNSEFILYGAQTQILLHLRCCATSMLCFTVAFGKSPQTYLLFKSLCVAIRQPLPSRSEYSWMKHIKPLCTCKEERISSSVEKVEERAQTAMYQPKVFWFTMRVVSFCKIIEYFQVSKFLRSKAAAVLCKNIYDLSKLKLTVVNSKLQLWLLLLLCPHNALWVEILLGSTFTTFNL